MFRLKATDPSFRIESIPEEKSMPLENKYVKINFAPPKSILTTPNVEPNIGLIKCSCLSYFYNIR